jgi:hypothetical protein
MKKLALFALMALCVGAVLSASPPDKYIAFTGFLTEGGLPVSDSCNFKFKIWDAQGVGTGNQKWEEAHNGIDVVDGEFSVYLGSVEALIDNTAPFSLIPTPHGSSVDFHSSTQYWLEILFERDSVPGFVIFDTRKSLSFAPYSVNADVIELRTDDPDPALTGRIWLRTDL